MARIPLENLKSPISLAIFAGATVVGLVVDLWTKKLAVATLSGTPPVPFIPGWLHFTYVENHGAVFGLGQGQRVFFIAVSIGAIAFLTYLFAYSRSRRFYQFLLGILLAGVLGNMYDRVVFGYVRDMIHALPDIHWPDAIARFLPASWAKQGVFPWVFNVADSLLCVGVFLMIVYSFFNRSHEQPQQQHEPVEAH